MSLLTLLALGVVASWSFLVLRVALLTRGNPLVRPEREALLNSHPTVTAIIPARNEEQRIERTLDSLLAQDYPALRIVVIDDQSTDATGTILDRRTAESAERGHSLRVLHGCERPPGWVGKTWAIHQATPQVDSEWLWFVDADIELHPQALATALAVARRTGADLVSFGPGVVCETFWQAVTAATLTQLLAHLYPVGRVNDPARPEAFAIGGFLLIRRDMYDRAGGHEAVRSEIVEDIQLAARVKAVGGRIHLAAATGLARTHMYGSLAQIWDGLRKNAFAGMGYRFSKYLTVAVIALLLAWVPIAALVAGLVRGDRPMAVVGATGWLAQVLATAPVLVYLRVPLWYAATLPLGITIYVAIATSSVRDYFRGHVRWKGRALPIAGLSGSPPGGR